MMIYIGRCIIGRHQVGETPTEQNAQKMQGLTMRGVRVSDGDRCSASFQRVFDHEAAELDKDLYEILGLQER